MIDKRVVPVWRQEIHQLSPFLLRKTRADPNMLQSARFIEKSKQQRTNRRALSVFVPPKPCNDAVTIPLVLHLQHHAFISLIGARNILRHHSIETGTLKAPEPVSSDTSFLGRRRYVNWRRSRGQQSLEPLPTISKWLTAKILIRFTQKIKEHHRSRHFLGQQLHPRSSRVYPQLQLFEVEPIFPGNHDLTIQHASFRQLSQQRFKQLWEIAVERFLIPALKYDFVSVTKDQCTKPIPLGLKEPRISFRKFTNSLCEHRQNRRIDWEIHA
jgi:hypothetical protein